FFFQAEDGIRDFHVTGVQTCALPISVPTRSRRPPSSPDTLQSSSITFPQDQGRSRRRAPAGTVRPPGRRRTRSAGSRRRQRYGRSEERRVGKESRLKGREEQ